MKIQAVMVHFNRINMQRGDARVWTVHTSQACHQVTAVDIRVPLRSVFKKDGRQPRAYFKGKAKVRLIEFKGAPIAVLEY